MRNKKTHPVSWVRQVHNIGRKHLCIGRARAPRAIHEEMDIAVPSRKVCFDPAMIVRVHTRGAANSSMSFTEAIMPDFVNPVWAELEVPQLGSAGRLIQTQHAENIAPGCAFWGPSVPEGARFAKAAGTARHHRNSRLLNGRRKPSCLRMVGSAKDVKHSRTRHQ